MPPTAFEKQLEHHRQPSSRLELAPKGTIEGTVVFANPYLAGGGFDAARAPVRCR
ncbi:MAG: hypothetical protein M3T49_02715 [Candidatus Eremiobacteraeota bacterium]|nr:hypothetical protein [Candidatus Eremiobacteraeota bacterium]